MWTGTFVSPPETAAARLVHLVVPVRDAAGRLAGGVALEVDARRYVTEAMESWAPAGDFWFALDGEGHALLMTPRAAASLGWNGLGGARLADAGAPSQALLAQRARTRSPASVPPDGAGRGLQPQAWFHPASRRGPLRSRRSDDRGEAAWVLPSRPMRTPRDVIHCLAAAAGRLVVTAIAAWRVSAPGAGRSG